MCYKPINIVKFTYTVIAHYNGLKGCVSLDNSERWFDILSNINIFFFFFQAEDGIRDRTVTGVQTCALPIFNRVRRASTSTTSGGGGGGGASHSINVGQTQQGTLSRNDVLLTSDSTYAQP